MAQYTNGLRLSFNRKESTLPPHVKEKWVNLSDLSRFLMGSDTVDEIIDKATRYITNILGIDYCRIIVSSLKGRLHDKQPDRRTLLPKSNPSMLDSATTESAYARLLGPENHLRLLSTTEHLTSVERASLGIKENENSWIVPLAVNSHGFGLLILGNRKSNGNLVLTEDFHFMVGLITDQLASAIHRAQMNDKLEIMSIETVIALSKTLETRDMVCASHSNLMASLSEQLAVRFNLTEGEKRELVWAALLHDIGKMGVEEAILKKPGPLSDKEWVIIRTHPEIGAKIVSSVSGLETIAPLIRTHHERYDGRGYPDRLAKEQIPFGGRILSVLDSYSTMIEGRPYQARRSHHDALSDIWENAGTAYDPDVVNEFVTLFGKNTN